MGIVIGIGLLLLAGGGVAVAFECSRAHALQGQAAEAQAAAQAADAAARARQTEALIIAMRNSQHLTTLLTFVMFLLVLALLIMIAVWFYSDRQRNRAQESTFQQEPPTAQMWAYYLLLRQKLSGYEFLVSPANTIVTANDPFWMWGGE